MKHAVLVLATSAILILGGCSTKPPECGDSDTRADIKKIIVTAIEGNHSKNPARDDPDGVLKKFTDSLKVEISDVVSEGYDEGAKKFSCRGELKVTMIGGETASREIAYSTQRTESSDKKFITRVSGFDEFIYFSARHADNYYISSRWAGTWNGALSCQGIDGATSGGVGPFQTPVTMKIEGNAATMDLDIQGGYQQSFRGRLENVAGIMKVPAFLDLYPHVNGASSTGPRLMRFKRGGFGGDVFEAAGETRTSRGVLQRSCKLELKRGGALPSTQKLAQDPILFQEEQAAVNLNGGEQILLLSDPEFLAEGTGVRFATAKGPLIIRSYDLPSFVIALKKGDCVIAHSSVGINFGEAGDSRVEKLSACKS